MNVQRYYKLLDNAGKNAKTEAGLVGSRSGGIADPTTDVSHDDSVLSARAPWAAQPACHPKGCSRDLGEAAEPSFSMPISAGGVATQPGLGPPTQRPVALPP